MIFLLLACSGGDTSLPACATGDTGDRCGAPTGDPDDPLPPPGPGTAEGSPSTGAPFVFEAESAVGGWNATDWGFSLLGDVPTNALSFGVAGPPGLGTYPLATPDDPAFSTYTDFRNFSLRTGAFVSTEGELTLTRWERSASVAGEAYEADGTFRVSYANGQEPPILLELEGRFTGVLLLGE